MVLRIILLVDGAVRPLCDKLERGVAHCDRQAKRQVQHAALAAVLEARACQANIGLFHARCAIGRPAEDGERSRTDLTFKTLFFLDHLHVWVAAETILTHGWKVICLAAGAVRIGFGRHGGGG